MKRRLALGPASVHAEVRPRFRGVLEELEPRLLFSADAAALLDPALLTGSSTDTAIQQFMPPPAPVASSQNEHSTDSASASTSRVELVFVDARVPDAQALVRLIEQQSSAPGRVLEIHWLSADRDGIDQISQVLAGREDISAVHLISHGSDGSLTLGNQALDTQTLTARAAELSRWGGALGSEADILLYGCDVAASEVGVQFLNDLSLLTGADVAASVDATGHRSLGGNWILEWQVGQIDTGTVLSSDLAASWVHILPTLTLRDGLNSYAGTSDTYLYTSTGIPQNVDKSTSTTLLAGEDGTGGQAQLLVKFDVSQIPVGSTINSVTLTMQITSANMFTSASFGLHRMLVNWSETSTWTTMGDGISDGTEASLTTDSSITEGGAGSYTFASSTNMKNTVQGWVNGSTNNYGWYFTAGGYQSRNTFASSEHATTTYRPTLTIDYTAPAPPTLDLDANNSSGATGSGYNGAFVENGAAVKIADTDATFTAGSSSTLSSMTVTISNLLNGTAESLDATTTGSITKSYNSATGVLTLSGTDTLANYQTVLRSITYNNTSDTPNTTNRTINVVATDPYAQTVSASSTLTVTATNDAPVITSNGGGATANVSVAETLTAVTTVTSTDPEGTARTYSIVAGGDGAKFSINSSTGVLTFVSAPDYEAPTDSDANNSYLVTVQASDGSLSDTQLITVTVTDVVSTLTVTTVADTNDTGLGSSFTAEQLNASKGSDSLVSLREAIIAANTTAGTDTINFAITGTAGTYGEYTIATSSALPTITQAVIINGASQTGYTNRPLVVIDGAGGGAYGLELSNTSDGSTIRGLLIRDFSSYGIYIPSGSDNQTIVGNFIGSFNADGSNAGVGKGNSVAGIYTRGANTLIGGTTAADRNVISGNGSYNIYLTTDADGSTIRGNYIGTNSAGSAVFSTTNPDYGIMVETSASNITIGGTASGAGNVISGHVREGVWVTTTGSVTLQGNYIGTDATGTVDLGNTRYGIYLDDTGSATIGGTTAGAGNVISGNNLGGIYASNGSIILQGNTIGLNAAGTAALGNTGSGVELRTSNASTLGGNTAAARNIISGNSSHGIQVETSKAHTIKGNYIGTGANGSTLLGNGGAGIYINASDIVVGGKTAGDGNLIAGNTGAGIAVVSGNGSLFYRNSIHSNGGLGIDLGNDGVTLNDYNDGDGGPNYSNNFPVITSVVTNGSSTTITGSIEWYPQAQPVYIELFSSPSADASGHGEGRTYLGYVQVTTDATTGDASFSTTLTGVSVGDWITAVANIEGGPIGASEFALAVQAVAPANAPRGRLIWNNNDRFFQYYADWSSAGFGGTGSNGLSYGDDISMILAAEAPTRNEILFIGSADVAGKILAGIWNGSSWSSVISIPVADPGADASSQNSFAVAYDNATGNAMLVWDNGGTGTTGLSYAVWNGSSWSAINTITAPVSGEPLHMQLVSSPSSSEMVLAVQTNNGSNSSYAMVWNGSSWGNAQVLGANSSNQFFELNVAYEQRSGRAMVLYDASAASSASVQYRVWNGSSWSGEGTVAAPVGITASSELYSTRIAADPTSNRIALAAKNAANEVWLAVWDGSAWGHTLAATTSGVDLTDHHATMDVAFESQSGDLLAAYGKAAGPNVAYRTWTSAGGWSAEMSGPSMGGTDVPYIVKLFSDPYSDTIMLGAQDNAADLNTAVWSGSAWGGVTTLDADTGFSYRENFSYVWYRSAPFISNLGGDTLAYQEGQGAVVIDQGTAASVVTGADSGYNGGNLTVSFVSGSTNGEDVLSVRHQGTGAGQIGVSGVNVSYEGTVIGTLSGGSAGASLVVLLNANATDAAVSALTRNITYQNTNTGAPSTSSRTVRFSATNGLAQTGISRDVTITVESINDAPVNTVPAAQSVNEDGTLVFSSSNGNLIAISDADAASGNMQVTLSVTNGVLSLSGTSGLSFSSGDGTADATMTFSGTVSAINTALAGLSYTPTAQYNGSATLTLLTSDLGNTGSGGTLTDSDTVAITVNAVNDAPVNSVPGAQAVNEDGTLVFSSGNGNLISISDVDAASGNMQVTLSVTNGVLSLSGTSGLSFSSGDGTADATMTFSGTVSAINTALAGLSYTPTAQYNGSATLTLLTSDLGNTGSGGTLTDSDTVAITVNAVNDAPVNSVPGAQSVNEDGSLVFSSGNGNLISISDVDAASGSMQVTLSVTNGTLSLSGTSGLSFSSGDGTADATMTFSGTVSAINTALAGLIYTPTAQYNGSATLTLITSDQGNTGSGGTLTDSDTVAITVNAVNDAPVNSVPGAQSVNEDDTLVFSSGNGNLISISDVDAASGSLQVTLSVTNGSLTLSGTSGLSFSNGDGTGDTTMTFSGTASAINTALAGLIYTPTAQYNGNATLTLQTSDLGNTGSGGPLTDSDTVAITVNAVNDAPVNSVPGAQSVNEDTALVFSSGNGNLISIADVDNGTMQVTLSVTNGSLTLSGTSGLTFSNGDGTSDATMTFTGSVSAINTALAGLIYMPTADVNGSATLTLLTSDLGNTGSGGPLTDSDTVAITVNAVNDAPVNSVPGAQSVNEDTNKVFSVANGNLISISDVDAGSSTMRVTIAATLGRTTLSTTAGLTFTAGDGTSDATMTFSGTASAINTALAGLIYRGNANVSGAGSITITTSDLGNTGSGGTLTDVDTIAVTINAVNDAPVNTKPGAQTVNEDTALVFSTANGNSISIADVDAGASAMQVTVSVTNGSLSLSGTTGLSFSVGDGSADTTMTFTGTLTNINNSLAGLSFNPTGDFNGAATLTIVTSDQGNTGSGGARSDTDTVAITVTAVNDAPVATITPPSYNATEQLALALQGTGLSISDVDAASGMLQATLSVASGTLTIAAGSTGVIVTGSGSNSVTLDGTLAQINALLAGTGGATISYVIASDTPPATDTLTLLISDLGNTGSGGILSASDTALINIAAVNDTPGVSITAPLYTVIESRSVSLHGSGLSVSDPDGGGIAAQVTLSVDLGTLTVLPGSTGVGVAGSGTGTVTLTGTIDQINALLDGTGAATISYTNDSGIPLADATLTLGINDLGNTGSGGALTASGSVLIDVIPPASMGSVLVPGISQGAIGAFYGFDATTALGRDDSGGGHDITLTGGASQTAGADGRQSALLLPGGGEGGDIAGLTTGGATTLATWVRFDATGTGDRVIDLGQASGAGIGNMVIARDGSSDQISFIIDVGGTQYTVSSAAGAITNGQWMHVAGTVDGTGLMTLYVNGAVAGSAQGVVLASGVRDHHYVGLSNTPGADSLQGAVNDLLILNQALTASQIAALAQAGGPSVQERAANGTVVGTVVSSSSNLGASISYTLSNSAGGRFTIDASTGVITVANGSALQHDLSSSHIITVRSTDVSDGSALDVNYTITLININDAPQGADTTVTLSEDGQHVFGLSDFGFGDVNDSSANQLLAVKISSLPLAGSLTLDGVAVNAGDTLLASDIALGKLVFTPAANAAGNAYASFGFQVQDDGGTALGGIDLDPTVRTLTLNVSAVNDAPLGSDATVQGTEDTPYVFSIGDFGFSDLEGHAFVSVTISSLPLGGTLTLDGVAVQANDVILSSDIALGKLVFTPTAQANGTAYAQMGFRVHDDGGVALGGVDMDVSVRTLTLDISPVNDAPMGSDGTLTVAEDSDHVLQASDFGFSDPDDGGAHQLQGVRFNVLPDVGTLTLNGVAVTVDQVVSLADINAGLLRYRAMADDNGVGYTRIGFHVQDDGGTALGGQNEDPVQRTLTVDVTPVNDAPVTIDTGASGAEDTPIAGLVTGSDIDGDALSFTLGSGPTRGSVVVAADGSFVYTPDANVHGGDSFTVIVSDGQGGSATSTVSITVTPLNDAPQTGNASASGAEDTPIAGLVTGSDIDGDALSFALGSGPTRGSVVVAADGSFVYTPDANVNGSDSFTVIVSDGQGGSATSTVSITVTPVNDQPLTSNASVSGTEDSPIAGVISGSDIDGDALSFTLGSGPTRGSVVVAADGSFVYTPDANVHGSDSFTVIVSDGQGGSATSTVSVTLTPVNDTPVTIDTSASGAEDSSISGAVIGSDVDGDPLSFTLGSGPTRGSVVVAADGSFVYTPDANVHGSDSFTVIVSDGQGGSSTSTVSIDITPVNDQPLTGSTSASGAEDTSITGIVAGSDIDGDTLSFTLGNEPTQGSVVVAFDGSFIYTPNLDAVGSDSFTVIVSDGQGGSATSTVSITLTPVNDAPVTLDTSASGAEDSSISGAVIGSDVDGDPLSFTLGSGPTRGSVVVAADGSFVYTPDANVHGSDSFTVIVSDGQGGSATSTVSITVTPVNDAPITLDTSASGAEDASISGAVIGSDVDGDTLSFALGSGPTRGSVVVAADGSFVYTPDANVNGSDSFTVIVSDGQGGSATSTVSVSITPVNDSPVGQDASASGAEDTVLTGVVSGSDVDGDALSYSLASGPTHGSVAVAADGSFSYTPAADFHGNDSFTVTVSDGQGGSSTCTVTLTLTPVNDAPVSADLGVAGLEDVALSGQLAGSDVDGDVPVFALASGPTHGQVTVGSDGGFTYVPTAHHHGQDSFTVSVSDGQGGQVISTVTLTLSPVNDAPTSQNLTLTGTQDQPLPGTVSGTDVDGDPLGFSLGTAPLHGSVSLGGNGAFTYTPTAQFTGSDSFTVVLSDGQGGSTLSTVSITVLPRVVMPPMGPPITVDPPVAPTTPIDMNPPGAGEGSNGGTTEEPVTEPGPQEPPPQEGGDEGTTDGPGGQGQDPVAVTPNRPGVGGGPLNDAGAGGADARQLGRLLLSAGGSWFTLQPREFEVPTFNLMAIEMSPVPSGISIMPSTPLSTGDIAFSLQGNRQTDSGPSMPWGLDKVSAEQLQVSGTVLSIGAVWWISRGATLISSLLLTTPVWRQIDPLPVFSQGRTRFDEEEPPSRHGDSDGSDGSDSDSDRAMNARAEGMFDQREENQPHSIG